MARRKPSQLAATQHSVPMCIDGAHLLWVYLNIKENKSSEWKLGEWFVRSCLIYPNKMWTNSFIQVKLSLDLQWCSWKQGWPHDSVAASVNSLLSNISCVLLNSSEASIKFLGTTLPFIYSCNQQEDSKKMTHCWNNGHQQKFSVFALLQFHWARGSFQPRWAVLGHCGYSGFTRVFLTECVRCSLCSSRL